MEENSEVKETPQYISSSNPSTIQASTGDAIPKTPSMATSQSPAKSPSPSVKKSPSPKKSPVSSPVKSQDSAKQSPNISFKSFKSVQNDSPPNMLSESHKSVNPPEEAAQGNVIESLSDIEPRGKTIGDQVDELTDSIKELSKDLEKTDSPVLRSNISKIANMSKILTNEAEALRESIKSLSQDIYLTKQELGFEKNQDVNFPYHLFLIEIIINNINMKCECFELDYNSLIITATFLGKQPVTLYDCSSGRVDDLKHLNLGKSILFALTYDKICSIDNFDIKLQMVKKPPCSNCVTRIAQTDMDYTKEFINLREELCKKWMEEKPCDNILCTTSTPLKKNMFYLMHGDDVHCEPIGVIEITLRMSFLGKEITTTYYGSSKNKCTAELFKDDHGVSMYSCQDVEMDVQGNVILNEDVIKKKYPAKVKASNVLSPTSQLSSNQEMALVKGGHNNFDPDNISRYNEIFTKINANELRIRVPKTTKLERIGKYDKIQELCTCESTPYNTGDQVQFELPKDLDKDNIYTSNIKYTYRGANTHDSKGRKIINVTPTNCPAPIDMQKVIHPEKDVFILRIGKKLETKDKKTDLEIELVTPKTPTISSPFNNHISQQCSSSTLKSNPKSKSKKKKEKKGKNLNKKSKSKGAGKQKKNK